MAPAKRKPPVKTWPTLEQLPPEVSLPMVAAFFHRHRSWADKRLDRGRAVLVVGDKVLPVHRVGRVWRAWKADVAELDREKVA